MWYLDEFQRISHSPVWAVVSSPHRGVAVILKHIRYGQVAFLLFTSSGWVLEVGHTRVSVSPAFCEALYDAFTAMKGRAPTVSMDESVVVWGMFA